jgi:transforming growth factor-beta-induced protein
MTNNNTWNFTSNAEGRSIWQLVNNAGDIIGQSSQSFASKAGAEYNAKLLGYKDSFSKQLSWDFFQLNNLWHWTCHNTVNKEEVGKSYNGFQSEADAMDNASLFGFDSNSYTMKSVVDSPAVSINAEMPKTNINFASTASAIPAVEVSKPAVNMDMKTSTPKIDPTYKPASYEVEEEGALAGIWKWLLPLLLVLLAIGILWWLLAGMNKSNVPEVNTPKLNVSSVNLPKVGNIFGALQKPEFSTLSTAIKASGLEGTINNFGPLTLLAPTNSGFEKLPEGAVEGLLKTDKLSDLQNLLKLHVLPGNVDLSKIKDGENIKTISGQELKASVEDGKLSIGGVEVIDTSTATAKEGDITVYGIPAVLSAPEKAMTAVSSSSAVTAMEKPVENKVGYFINTAKADGRFGTLLSLVKQVDLEGALDQAGPFTVFAPTDEAFASLGEDTLTALQKPENKAKLAEILKYHVVSGKNDFAKFGENTVLTTLNGNAITLGLDDHGQGFVKGSKNTALAPVDDINTDNAIIHVLTDTPLLQ